MIQTTRAIAPRTGRARLAALLAGTSLLICAREVSAAETNKPNTIDEVIVTASGTEQNLQTVPITVTVVNPEILKQQNIYRPSELKYTVPSLTIAPSFNSLNNAFSVRGLAAGVTTYFAEANCCTAGSAVPFLDVESIQVLNGPQGTLFGRTSGSGAILITPVRPNLTEREGEARVTFGDYGRLNFTGAVSMPIIPDQLAVRLAVNSTNMEGFTKQIGSESKLDEERSHQIRLSVLYKSEKLENYTSLGAINLNQNNNNSVLAATNVNGISLYNLPAAAGPAVFGAICSQAVSLGAATSTSDCIQQRLDLLAAQRAALLREEARIASGGKDAVRLTPAPIPGQPTFLKLKDWSILNVAQFDLGQIGPVRVKLKDIFSYEKITNNTAGPADGIGGLAQNAGAFNTAGVGANNISGRFVVPALGPYAQILTNEFKVDLDVSDGLIISSLGYFYSHTKLPATDKGTGNIYTVFGAVLSPLFNYSSAQGFQAGSFSEQTGVYGQATLDASRFGLHGLKLTAGYRRSEDEQADRRFAAVLSLPQAVFVPGPTTTESRLKTHGYNYNLSATQQINDDLMVYVSQTRAYIPGGINVLIQGNTTLPNYKPIYDPQTIVAREIGTKVDFRFGQVAGRINAAAYHYDFTDIAVGFSGFTGTASIAYTANVAAAKLEGFEIYGNIIPFENWQIRGSYNHNDAHYTDWTASDPHNAARPGDAICSPKSQPKTCLIDLTNNPFQRMPEHQGNITVVYSPPIDPSLGQLRLSASVYAQSLVWYSSSAYRLIQVLPTAKPGISQKGYSLLNLRADWKDFAGSGFDAALYVSNATDKVYANGKTPQLLTLGYSIANYAPPRMIGIELGKRF